MVLSSMQKYRFFLYGGGGAACLSVGAILLYAYMNVVKAILYQQLKMTEGSQTFLLWRDTPVPQTMNFYLYNWTNPEDIKDLSVKPQLTEMGPYSFKVIEKKTNITWNSNGTITFRIQRTWFFDPENTVGSLDDEVTTLNSVAMSAANAVRNKDTFLKKGFSTTLWATRQQLFVRKKVGDILFFGYSDLLLDVARELPALDGVQIPPFDKFAWFYLRNGSDTFEGTFEMDTGINDIFSFGVLKHWNYDNQTHFYPPPCGLVNGSAGELYPPERTKTKSLDMFSADLCRSISLSYTEEESVQGVTGYKYVGDVKTFDNGTLDAANKCFCGGECSPSGTLNVTACRFGAPGFVSFPHFYLADRYYENQFQPKSVEPRQEAHQMHIILEPFTGIPLDVAARFQINILLREVQDISLLEGVPKIYFPVIWFEQKATITEELAAQIRLVLHLPLIVQCLGAFLAFAGIIILIVVVLLIRQPVGRGDIQDFKLSEGTTHALIESKNSNPVVIQKQLLVTQT